MNPWYEPPGQQAADILRPDKLGDAPAYFWDAEALRWLVEKGCEIRTNNVLGTRVWTSNDEQSWTNMDYSVALIAAVLALAQKGTP
jgi:hypothetical protein